MYYNNEIKMKYLNTISSESTKVYLEYLFASTYDMEKSCDTDVAVFDMDHVEAFFGNISTLSLARKARSGLKSYSDFYIAYKNIDDSENRYKQMKDARLLEVIRNQREDSIYIPRDRLLDIISNIPNAIDRFLLLAIYEGIKGEKYINILMLRERDINFEEKIFYLHDGKKITVSDELLNTVGLAIDQRIYNILKENYSFTPSRFYLEDNDYVFRVSNNASAVDIDAKYARIYRRFIELKKFLNDPMFSATRVFNSGYVYQILQIQKKYDDISFKELRYKPEIEEVHHKFGMMDTFLRTTARLKDYFTH